MQPTTAPADLYRERRATYEAHAAAEARASARFSRARLATAAVGLTCLVLLVQGPAWWWTSGVGASLVVFLWLVVRHDRTERRRDAALAMAVLNADALARLARDWRALPAPWHVATGDDHPYAADLDVFGHASLAQILGPVRTPTGRRILGGWLLRPDTASLPDIEARQDAVRELAPALDFRQQFAALARLLPRSSPRDPGTAAGAERARGASATDADALPAVLHWAEAPDALASHAWVPGAAVALGVLTTAGALGAALGFVTGAWWMLTGALGWGLRWWVHDAVEHSLGGASGEQGLRPWAALIAHVDASSFTTRLLAAARARLHGPHGSASHALATLEQLVALSDVRHSLWLYVPLQTLTLWDLHAWWAIERWRRRHGHQVRAWLEAMGEIDALGAVASLGFDHPQWVFPTLDPGLDRFEAVALGHPLLGDEVRVTNDVVVGPPGRFLLITGSNMSGKSTLLRAVGLNVVLAQAGAPVCATHCRLPPLQLHTSMRVSDSLELGLSLFMASLVRLQRIVEAARAATAARRVCYLLDEVLQGTNSAERQIAVRTVMGHLTRCEAIGAVTTHDLELASDPAFTAHADSAHLQETLSGDGGSVTMSFDYRLRPGPARSGNALQLLRLLGLADAAGPEAS